MYKQFFRLKENPFKLSPDPAYLFLSSGHEEALAHLKYGISQGEGFISITGKTGVGKTLTCMAFIASLGEKTEVAYISNPTLSSEQLLNKIYRIFKINSDERNAKSPLNAFYSFLMEKRLGGKRVVLFIDEAQKLQRDAIEQLRLLSNLETSRDKLLQIVLVGQPELTETLNSYELRQIGQRISVSYHINPLTSLETKEYILYRLNIASQGTRIEFDQSVFHHIFRYSSGIPRLVNIACDKVLSNSYIYSQKRITGDIAKAAIKELYGKEDNGKWIDFLTENQSKLIIAGCCVSLLIVAAAYFTKIIGSTAGYNFEELKKVTTFQREPAKLLKLTTRSLKPKNIPKVVNKSTASRKSEVATGLKFSQPQKAATEAYLPSKMTHSVQVGAFLIKKNAERITSILIKKGYAARIVIFNDSKKRVWHTVRIGDYPSREIAKEYADAFTAKEKRESAVVPVDNL
jgi:type II secretory pathway predicted ATPase ExeA/cell division septation protein DedD